MSLAVRLIACAASKMTHDDDWFSKLSAEEQDKYLRQHPGSEKTKNAHPLQDVADHLVAHGLPAHLGVSRGRPAVISSHGKNDYGYSVAHNMDGAKNIAETYGKKPKPKKSTKKIGDPVHSVSSKDFSVPGVNLESNGNVPATLESWKSMVGDVPPHELKTRLFSGTGVDPHLSIESHGSTASRIDVNFHAKDAEGKQSVRMTRGLYRDSSGRLVAHHDVMQVDDAHRGLGKSLLRNSMREYRRMGVHHVELEANIDVGGYAWAKYGFLPSSDQWYGIRDDLRERVGDLRAHMSPSTRQQVDKLLSSDDPKSLWDLADLSEPVTAQRKTVWNYDEKKMKEGATETHPVGRHLLLNSTWQGRLQLDDDDAMRRFDTYVGK